MRPLANDRIWLGMNSSNAGPWVRTTRWMSAPRGSYQPGAKESLGPELLKVAAGGVTHAQVRPDVVVPVGVDDVPGVVLDRGLDRLLEEVLLAAAEVALAVDALLGVVEDHPPDGDGVTGRGDRVDGRGDAGVDPVRVDQDPSTAVPSANPQTSLVLRSAEAADAGDAKTAMRPNRAAPRIRSGGFLMSPPSW